jgi:hypothetical protein
MSNEQDTTVILEPTSAPRVALVIVLELLIVFGGSYGAWYLCGRPGVAGTKRLVVPPQVDAVEDIAKVPTAVPAEDAVEPDITLNLREDDMRFGLTDNRAPWIGLDGAKRLTQAEDGSTNKTLVTLDGKEFVCGQAPGRLGVNSSAKKTLHARGGGEVSLYRKWESSWLYPESIHVIQTVMLVRNSVTQRVDTCLVHYKIENRDQTVPAHLTGLAFSLDTAIDCDNSALAVEGHPGLLTEDSAWQDERVPRFAQALEHPNLLAPGLIYHLGLRLPADYRLNAGDPELEPLTGVKLTREKNPNDAGRHWRVTLSWPQQQLERDAVRTMAFSYGLNKLEAREEDLGISCHPSFGPSRDFTAIAWGTGGKRKVRLILPDGMGTPAESTATLTGEPRELGLVSWPVHVSPRTREGAYRITVSTPRALTTMSVPIQSVGGEARP